MHPKHAQRNTDPWKCSLSSQVWKWQKCRQGALKRLVFTSILFTNLNYSNSKIKEDIEHWHKFIGWMKKRYHNLQYFLPLGPILIEMQYLTKFRRQKKLVYWTKWSIINSASQFMKSCDLDSGQNPVSNANLCLNPNMNKMGKDGEPYHYWPWENYWQTPVFQALVLFFVWYLRVFSLLGSLSA